MRIENTILAGDTGGTKTILSLFQEIDGKQTEVKTAKFASADFTSLEAIIRHFLLGCEGLPMAAAFGIPGPVTNGVVKSTNLPWTIEEKQLRLQIGIPRVKLVNDLVATAYSLPYLSHSEFVSIKPGKTPIDPERYVVLAPGTGLGQSYMVRDGGKAIVIPSEGGHADFAPTNELEGQLFLYLFEKYGHVSYERVISGSGLPNIFDFLVSGGHQKAEPATLEKMYTHDKAMVISEMALEENDAACVAAMNIFVTILGTKAGNEALSFLSNGGVFLAGGIPAKILPHLKTGIFTDSFLNKGRMRWVLEDIPVHVITNDRAALQGSAQIALDIHKH